jgi:outer membrane protein assembly factor BamD (BamD/ComL family)
VQTDFATLGQDLQAGNLTQSQTAFSELQSAIQTATESPAQQVQQDYTQLASALQNGNLASAQSAFSALTQALQTQSGTNASSTATSTNSNDPIANDLNALGQALTSGNLTQAQSAFAQLNSAIQSAQPNATQPQRPQGEDHHRHHHGGDGWSSTPSSTSTSSSSSNSYTSSNSSSSVNVYA